MLTTFKILSIQCCLVALIVGCAEPISSTTGGSSPSTEMVAQKATAGVAKEGQKFKNDSGVAKIITGPAAALANFKQKAIFDIQLKQAIDVFRAEKGRLPKSHEEFMQRCVEAYKIRLPELPAGSIYRFNVEKGELWVYPEDQVPSE